MSSPRATIFNLQRFSIHDGPGIRTTVFFKGCPLRCRWCQNPESLSPRPELAFYADRCRARGDCLSACPHGALHPGADRIDRERCDGCGDCVAHCSLGALQRVGREVELDELVAELLRDRPFYAASGGGVTLSGGEATGQLDFVAALCAELDQAGVGVALQSCGAFRWDRFAPLLGRFELIQYDLKLIDPAEHRRLTGADNRTILDNARRLVEAAAPVSFRMPIVPDHTDSDANLDAVAEFLVGLGVTELHLLRYHPMGEVKSQRLGWPLPALPRGDGATADQRLARAANRLRARGLEIHLPEPT